MEDKKEPKYVEMSATCNISLEELFGIKKPKDEEINKEHSEE